MPSILAAILYEPNQHYRIETLNLKEPAKGEVLVRMSYAGLCGSDESVRTGKRPHAMPVVTGHEGCGWVEGVGKGVKRVKEGDFIILNWQPACGRCVNCQRQRPYLCSTFPERDTAERARFSLRDGRPVFSYSHLGCFAQNIVVQEECCVPIAKKIPESVACLIGCAVTTGVGAVLNTAKVRRGEGVAIFGMGGVGLSCVMGAKLAGANPIIAVDSSAGKRQMALDLGATEFLSTPAVRPEPVEGRRVDYAFDCVGQPEVTRQCFESVGPGGTVTCVGLPPMQSEFSLPGWRLVASEKKVIGSLYGSADCNNFFPYLVDLYNEGQLPLDKLIAKVYRLRDINEGLEALGGQNIGRGVIRFK